MSDSVRFIVLPSESARFVVIRPAPDLPEGFLPPGWNGRWFDLRRVPESFTPPTTGAVAVATGRFERREDGAVAEVYEVRQ